MGRAQQMMMEFWAEQAGERTMRPAFDFGAAASGDAGDRIRWR